MPYKDNLLELNNETNNSMLSSNLFLSKPIPMRNQITDISCFMKDANITYNTSNDTTKINSNGILNTSYQKTVYLSNETINDSNCQTDANYSNNNNIREIRVNMASKQRKNLFINSKNSKMVNIEFNVNNFQELNDGMFNDEDKIKKILFIQQWWKTTYKVIYIQKCLRGFFSRKRITNLLYFIKCLIKLLFKLLISNIKQNINSKVKNNKLANNNFKKINNNNQKFNKIGSNIKVNKNNNKSNNNNTKGASKNSFLSSLNKRVDELRTNKKKIKLDNNSKKLNNSNNPINNNNKAINQNQNLINNTNDSKCFNKLKNKKNTKDSKVKETNNISNKDKLTAYKNIYNIYNNVKKYYENDNNVNFCDGNYSTVNKFYPRNKKSSPLSNSNALNNKKMKSKIIAKRGSMGNINEKIIINKNNNINLNININNSKTDRVHRYSRSPNVKDTNSILYLLKLKKAFIFWKTYITKKKIVQKLKIMKNIKTPNNVKRTLALYSNREPEKKSTSITTKKINLSNSLMNFKLSKITPKKLKSKNNNSSRKNYIFNNYTKKSHTHSNSVESNSLINFKPQESDLNSNFENNNEINLKSHNSNSNNNGFSNDLGNNSVIIISQYDRNNEVKKNKKENNNINEENDNKNKTKEKVYYFYAIINLIDKHNKRKRTKKCFNLWKSYLRISKSFINSKGIEEKIISFKTYKSPPKNTLYESRFNKNVVLGQNNSSSNFNCQTESGYDNLFGHAKVNSILCPKDLLTPNPIEKSIHPNFFKSNYKQPKIVYQKKFLAPKKMRNQSMHILNINDIEDERNNMTLMDNNREINILSQTSGNTFYNTNTYSLNNNNNDLNKSVFLRKRNFENSAGKIHEGRLNKVNEIEETEIHFSPTSNHTQKINYEIGNNYLNGDTGHNGNKINVNVNLVQNFRRIDVKKEGIENNQNINNEKSRITTKQIILREKRNKNNSQSKEVS